MNAHIRVGLLAAVIGDQRKPGARHHHGGGRHNAGIHQVGVGCDSRLAHADVVGVDDDKAIIGRKAKPFQYGVREHVIIHR